MAATCLEDVIPPSILYEAWEKVRDNKGVSGK